MERRKVDDAIKVASKEIALLQEFRTRLTTDLVTGKLDIRAAAINVPKVTEFQTTEMPPDDEDADADLDQAETEELAA